MSTRTSIRTCVQPTSDLVRAIVFKYELTPSADLELTVSLLVQIDKLVMLIESPVFLSTFPLMTLLKIRSQVTIVGTGQIPIPT